MPDRIQSQRIICQGGLNTSQNFLVLSETAPGAATRLVNYEWSVSGGYRRINGYDYADSVAHEVTNATDVGTGPVLGIFGFVNSTSNTFELIACRKKNGTSNYKFYKLNAGVGWTSINTGTTQVATSVTRVRSESFTDETGNKIAFVDGVNKPLIYDGTSWYQLSAANLGGSGSPGGDQLTGVNNPSVVTYFKKTLFFGGDPAAPAIAIYSAPDDPFTWTAAGGAGQLPMGFPIVQMKPFRDENYIFGISAIRKALADEAAGFVLQDVTNNIGCIARDSVTEVGGNLIFLSPDGIRPVAGTSNIGDVHLSLLSPSIQNTIKNIITNYDLTELNVTTIRSKSQFRYFISDSSIPQASAYGLIGAFNTFAGNGGWEFGELMGIHSNTSWSGYDEDGVERIFHGNYAGIVYEQEVGNSFATAEITAIYTTPYLDFGDTEIRKLFRTLNIFIRAEGALTISVSAGYDWDRTTVLNPNGYEASTDGAVIVFDSGVLFDDPGVIFASTSQPIFPVNIQGSGYAVQFTIYSSGTYDPYTIQGMVVELSTKGRE